MSESNKKRSYPTRAANNDFLDGTVEKSAQYSAREVLTYLYAESKWTEDVDGDCEDGVQRVYVNHDVRIRDSLLEELLDMAGIKKASIYETPLERLARANEEECSVAKSGGA